MSLSEPEPWAEPVDGAELLDDLSAWFTRYVHLPPHAAVAIVLWAAATWYIAFTYFAPLLAILSATKQCGKTLMLDLLRYVVRLGHLTSGTGVTAPVIFRLNEAQHPTFLVDEAEKLMGRHADRELIGMLNIGYRRGARALRCIEANGDYVVRDFDAFGFRALAAIGLLWDTIMDRAVVIRMDRKPTDVTLTRFSGRQVASEGNLLARRLCRWSRDHAAQYSEQEDASPRPTWLDDRACDNWSALFAVAALAGGPWPERAEAAAHALRPESHDEGDRGERLVHDVRDVFKGLGNPEAIASGDLVAKLNAIETSPWGEERRGDGLSTHGLAALLRRFQVRPSQERTSDGTKVRGYWLRDLLPLFQRYPPKVGQLGQDRELGQESSENAGTYEAVPHVPVQAGGPGLDTNVPLPDAEADMRRELEEGA